MNEFKIGQFVTVSIGSGFDRSSDVGTVDGFTPTGQVRVRLGSTKRVETFRAHRVHAMSDARVARYRWLTSKPKSSALVVRSLGEYYRDDRPGYVETFNRVPLANLESMRAEIDALIAWRDAEPKERP